MQSWMQLRPEHPSVHCAAAAASRFAALLHYAHYANAHADRLKRLDAPAPPGGARVRLAAAPGAADVRVELVQ